MTDFLQQDTADWSGTFSCSALQLRIELLSSEVRVEYWKPKFEYLWAQVQDECPIIMALSNVFTRLRLLRHVPAQRQGLRREERERRRGHGELWLLSVIRVLYIRSARSLYSSQLSPVRAYRCSPYSRDTERVLNEAEAAVLTGWDTAKSTFLHHDSGAPLSSFHSRRCDALPSLPVICCLLLLCCWTQSAFLLPFLLPLCFSSSRSFCFSTFLRSDTPRPHTGKRR